MNNDAKPKADHYFLHIHGRHLGEGAARKVVKHALEKLGLKLGKIDWLSGTVTWSKGEHKTTKSFISLVDEAKTSGVCTSLQRWIDLKDEFFGSDLEIATDSPFLKMGIKYAGYEGDFQGPGRVSPMENELTEDILFYRRATCNNSKSHDFVECTRFYRSYLQTSISLIEAFLNRHILIFEHEKPGSVPDELKKPGRFEDRITLWIEAIAIANPLELKQSAEWSKLTELRRERNKLVHSTEPYFGISIKDMPKYLNYTSEAVGGTILILRRLMRKGTLGFIERLKSAPEVSFRSK